MEGCLCWHFLGIIIPQNLIRKGIPVKPLINEIKISSFERNTQGLSLLQNMQSECCLLAEPT